VTEWNIDLVLGSPPGAPVPPPPGTGILRARPSTIRIAVEAKAIMTEHRKAARNRQRDLDAFHKHVHDYDPNAVAGGLVQVNIAPRFTSPLRNRTTTCPKCAHVFTPHVTTKHKQPASLVKFAVDLFRGLPVRAVTTGSGLEAICAVVLHHTNDPRAKARIHTAAPAPQVGDPLHYAAFVQRICQHYSQRWP
jgi:hypothetical protein